MAVTTTKTNKPLNPRGNDQSPKGYNRAELYTGKALDFDGVNDQVEINPYVQSEETTSICFYMKQDAVSNTVRMVCESNAIGKLMIHTGGIGSGGMRFGLNNTDFFDVDNAVPDTDMHFYSMVYDSTNTHAYLYRDGVLFADENIDLGSLTTTSSLFISGRNNGQYILDGQLAGFKIFNTALTAAQVADLYNNPEKIVPTGVADSALKLWLPMMEGAGTTAYNGAPDALGSNVVTNGTFDDNLDDWNTNAASNGSITYDNGTALVTSNGGTGYPSINQNITTTIGTRYIVKADISDNTTGAWLWKHDDTTNPLGNTNRVKFIDNDTSSSIDAIFEFTATATTTVIVAFAEQGDAGSFNLDNVEVLPMSNIGTISGATWTHGIGAPVSQTAVINWNKHILAGVGQTQNEILLPEGLTAGRDLLGNLFENVRKQGALNLDGNSWAEVHDNASLDITDAITLEAWVYFDGSTDKGILGRWNTYTNKRSYLLYNNGTRFRFYVSSDGTLNNNEQNDTTISAGWNHIVGVYDGSKIYTYLNGAVDGSQNYSSDIDANDSVIEIGRYRGDSGKANTNQIAQPRIYNRALTAEEVERNYTAGKYIYTND